VGGVTTLRASAPASTGYLHDIFKHVHQDFKDAKNTTPRTRDRKVCNYRGISLMSSRKVRVCVLSICLHQLAEVIHPEFQCGFQPNRFTTNMIFETITRENNQPLYLDFERLL